MTCSQELVVKAARLCIAATRSTLKISLAANLGRYGRVDGVVDDEDLVGARARGLGAGVRAGVRAEVRAESWAESWAVWQVDVWMGGRGLGPRGRYNLRDHEECNRRLVADEGDRVHQRVGFGRVERKDELEDPVQGEAQTHEPVWLSEVRVRGSSPVFHTS